MRVFNILPLITFVFISMACCSQPGATKEEDTTQNDFIVLDAHTHHGFPSLDAGEVEQDIKYLKGLGYDAICYALPIDRSGTDELWERILEEVEAIRRLVESSTTFSLGSSAPEDDKLNCFFGLEYFGGVFDRELRCIDTYKASGISYITLMNNRHDKLFAAGELTAFGRKVIEEMNRAGIVVDISHLNNKERLSAIRYSKKPVISSHRNCFAVAAAEANLSDEVLEALKTNGGMVMLIFSSNGLFRDRSVSGSAVEKLVEHINHLHHNIGMEYIGFGTDLQANGRYVPREMADTDTFNEIAKQLRQQNYSDQDIDRIFSGNYLEFMELDPREAK